MVICPADSREREATAASVSSYRRLTVSVISCPLLHRSCCRTRHPNKPGGLALCLTGEFLPPHRPTAATSCGLQRASRPMPFVALALRGRPTTRKSHTRLIRSACENPTCIAMASMDSAVCSTRRRASSTRSLSTSFAGVSPVSALKARPKCRELKSRNRRKLVSG